MSVTYGVGGFPALSAIAGAYVGKFCSNFDVVGCLLVSLDNVAVIFIAGTPSTSQWQIMDSFGIVDHHQFPVSTLQLIGYLLIIY